MPILFSLTRLKKTTRLSATTFLCFFHLYGNIYPLCRKKKRKEKTRGLGQSVLCMNEHIALDCVH